jgi:hypothetical protein
VSIKNEINVIHRIFLLFVSLSISSCLIDNDTNSSPKIFGSSICGKTFNSTLSGSQSYAVYATSADLIFEDKDLNVSKILIRNKFHSEEKIQFFNQKEKLDTAKLMIEISFSSFIGQNVDKMHVDTIRFQLIDRNGAKSNEFKCTYNLSYN